MTEVSAPLVAVPPLSNLRRRLEALALSLTGGLLLIIATFFPGAGPFLGLGAVLLLTPAVVDRWRAPLIGFIPGHLLFIWVGHWPIKSFGALVPWVLPPILTYHFLVTPLLAYALHRLTRWPRYLLLPVAVTAGEWTRALLGVGQFNMYQTGTFLFHFPNLIQAADLVGSAGLSFLWTIPWAVMVDGLVWRWEADLVPARRRFLHGLALAAAVLLFLPLYGWYRLSSSKFTPGPRVAVVQPSLDHFNGMADKVMLRQIQLTNEGIPSGSADLMVWPENSVLKIYSETPDYQNSVAWLARIKGAPLLFGAQERGPGESFANTAFLVDGTGKILGRSRKMVLFPFTERRAFPGLEARWPWLKKQLTTVTLKAWDVAPEGWSPSEVEVIDLPQKDGPLRLWTPICYESCYPELGREAARKGARIFVNLTAEGWLGWPGSNNMLAVNIMRAVENRVGLIRAGNTGPSGFILPDGRVDRFLIGRRFGRLRLDEGVLVHQVFTDSRGPTIYTRLGGLLDLLAPLAALGGLIFGSVRNLGTRRLRKNKGEPAP